MTSFSFASYGLAAFFYAALAVLLCTSWRGRVQGGLMLLAVIISLGWTLLISLSEGYLDFSLKHLLAVEVLRNIAWTAFIWALLSYSRSQKRQLGLRFAVVGYLVICGLTITAELVPRVSEFFNHFINVDFRILSHVVQAVVGLLLVEQLFRRTRRESRWAVKFLCFALGGLFVYDFVLFAEAMMLGRIDNDLWQARGGVNALIVPFIAVAAARNPQWSVDIFVSRAVVFHTTALMATGFYLLLMAVVGYYLRDFGGSWGKPGQIIFVFASLLCLIILMFSGRMRARI